MRIELDAVYAAAPLRAMAPETRKAIRSALRKLAADPSGRTVDLDVKALDLGDGPPVHRLRVGEWRAAFIVGKELIRVLRVFHRSDGYDWVDDVRLGQAIDDDVERGKKRK
ncbi:MAG TPA: type II toxin-antitoxin system RelE/ParE family toxin [Candidatus Thermoplasmatota archaeon]|nr:type II toxin-antitoxin system RelE/ParE family toxin [Candidatus Thermoplasmatota archaeon]